MESYGVQLMPEFVQLVILLFADDLAVISNTSTNLCAHRMGLEINTNKTNVMIFRLGGGLAANEK